MARAGRAWMLAVLLLPLAACNQLRELTAAGPDAAISGYLNATIRGDLSAAYGYLSSSDQEARSLAEYTQAEKHTELGTVFASKMSFEVIQVREHGDTATASVSITAPDVQALFADAMGGAFASTFSGKSTEEAHQELAAKYADSEVPMAKTRQDFTLVREADGWRVFLDWATQHQVKTLLVEADELKDANKLHTALDKYNQVLELDSEVVEAAQEREKLQDEIAAFEEKQAYISSVELRNLRVADGQKYSFSDPEPGVFGTIANNGDRTLDKVEVTVYFLDEHDTVVGEEDYHPILVSKYSFGDSNKPLKPNYVKDFGYTVEDKAPSNWDGKVKAQITDIAFAD